jgi:hypothetical protein
MEIRPKEEQKHPNGHQFINKERKEQKKKKESKIQ